MGSQAAGRRSQRRGLLRRLLARRRPELDAPASAMLASRSLGEPSAPGSADDAELDALRGELVRELDRIAAKGGGPDAFRRG